MVLEPKETANSKLNNSKQLLLLHHIYPFCLSISVFVNDRSHDDLSYAIHTCRQQAGMSLTFTKGKTKIESHISFTKLRRTPSIHAKGKAHHREKEKNSLLCRDFLSFARSRALAEFLRSIDLHFTTAAHKPHTHTHTTQRMEEKRQCSPRHQRHSFVTGISLTLVCPVYVCMRMSNVMSIRVMVPFFPSRTSRTSLLRRTAVMSARVCSCPVVRVVDVCVPQP